MTIQLGDTVPDFTAATTEGEINFHDWLNGQWAVLFSHPKNFTPVCTTELGDVSRLKPEFDRRGVKVIGLSVDELANHDQWADDIEQTQGHRLNFPLIADADRKVSTLYGMIHPGAVTDAHNVFPMGKVTWPRAKAMAGPAAIPKAPAVTKSALAAVRSALEKTSAMYRRLMDRALPNPFKNRPTKTMVKEL